MEIAALVVALVALVVALKKGGGGASGGKDALEDLRRDVRRDAENLAEEVRRELETTRRLLAEVASGAQLEREQILEGRLWRDVDARDAVKLVGASGVHVLDVRTNGETIGGVIPGAQLLPVGELEERVREVPRDAKTLLVVCAGGGRSAAACEFLAGKGYAGLLNLTGGMGAWNGPVVKPGTAK
jgi:rhodanese-related sulfurtransferase